MSKAATLRQIEQSSKSRANKTPAPPHVVKPAAAFTPLSLKALRDGIDVEYKMFRPSQLQADMSYQRDPKKRLGKLQRIAANFDLSALKMREVCIREDGSIMVIDGWGSTYVMTNLIHYDEPVPCRVHKHIKTKAQEAMWFLILNPDEIAKVNQAQKYHARLQSHDKECLAIEQAANVGGLVVTGAGKNGISFQAAQTLNKLGVLTRVGFLKNNEWAEYKVPSPFLIGLGSLFIAVPNIPEARVRKMMQKHPYKVVDTALRNRSAGWPHARAAAPLAARIMMEFINKGSPNKLKANWSLVDFELDTPPFTDRWTAMP